MGRTWTEQEVVAADRQALQKLIEGLCPNGDEKANEEEEEDLIYLTIFSVN